MKKTILLCNVLALTLLLAAPPAPGAINWTGAAGTDLFDEGNWDFSGSTVTTIDPNVSIMDDLFIGNSTADIPQLSGQQRFQIGNGFTFTLDNAVITVSGNDGVGGESTAGVPKDGDGIASYIEVINGSILNTWFATQGITVNVDGTSTIWFGGGGDPINSQTEWTKINLTAGAQITLPTAAEFNEQGEDILVNGQVYDDGVNPANDALFDNTGNVRIAVPEPSSLVLLALGAGAMLIRRRRA